jgi:hypothetical protein
MPSPFREYAKGYVFWRNSAKFCYREKIHFREKNTFFAIIDIFSTVSRICCGSTQNFEKLSEKQIFSHNFSQKHFCYISKIFKLKWSIIVVDCLVSVVGFRLMIVVVGSSSLLGMSGVVCWFSVVGVFVGSNCWLSCVGHRLARVGAKSLFR